MENTATDGEAIGRPLESLEAYFEIRNRNSDLNITNVIFVNGKFALDVTILTRALGRIAAAHPMMRMKIIQSKCTEAKSSSDREYLVFKEMANFSPDVEVLATKDWTQSVEDETARPFDSAVGPLWRVKMLESLVDDNGIYKHTLIYSFHHAICDGASLKIFREQLLHELTVCSRSDADIPTAVTNSRLPPSYVDVLGSMLKPSVWTKIILSLGFKLSQLFGRTTPRGTSSPRCSFVRFAATSATLDSTLAAKTKMIALPPQNLDPLLRRCRAHDCKLQGTLMALVDLALVQTLDELNSVDNELPETLVFSRSYSLNLRLMSSSPPPPDAFGFCSGISVASREVSSSIQELQRTFWTSAKSISDEVHESRRHKPVSERMQMGEYLYRAQPEVWRRNVGRPEPQSFKRERIPFDYALLNTGPPIESETDPDFEVDALYSAFPMTLAVACLCNIVLSSQDKLCWSITYGSNIVSEKQAKLFATKVEELLGLLADGLMG